MANLSREEEQRIAQNIKLYGTAVHNPNGWTVPSTKRAEAYNAVHGTRIGDDDALDRVLEIEREINNAIRQKGE